MRKNCLKSVELVAKKQKQNKQKHQNKDTELQRSLFLTVIKIELTLPLPFGQGGLMKIWTGQIVTRPGARKNRKKIAMEVNYSGLCSPIVIIK